MKVRSVTRGKVQGLGLLLALSGAATVGCSDDDSTEEAVTPSGDEAAASDGESKDAPQDSDAEAAPAGAAAEAAASDDSSQSAPASAAAAPAPAAAPMAPMAPMAPATAPAAPAAPVASAPAGTSRVVRYVKVSQTELRASPADSATSVGQLLKGERVMVLEENGWGRVTDTIFVKLDDLSNKAVARDREPANWTPPAH